MMKRLCQFLFAGLLIGAVVLTYFAATVLAEAREAAPSPTQQNAVFLKYVYCSALAAGAGITTKSALYRHRFGWTYFDRTEVHNHYVISPLMSPGYSADAATVSVWVEGGGIIYAADTCRA